MEATLSIYQPWYSQYAYFVIKVANKNTQECANIFRTHMAVHENIPLERNKIIRGVNPLQLKAYFEVKSVLAELIDASFDDVSELSTFKEYNLGEFVLEEESLRKAAEKYEFESLATTLNKRLRNGMAVYGTFPTSFPTCHLPLHNTHINL
jgi:hypothetical protein